MIRSRRVLLVPIAAVTVLSTVAFVREGRAPVKVQHTDFAKTITPPKPAYDAALAPASSAPVKEFRIPMTDEKIDIAKGITYQGVDLRRHGPGPRDSRSAGRSRPDHRGERDEDAALDRLPRGTRPGQRGLSDDHAARLGELRVRGARSGGVPGALRHAADPHAPHAGDVLRDNRGPQGRLGDQGRQGIRPGAERVLRAGRRQVGTPKQFATMAH